VTRLKAMGLPEATSDDAGSYLCNAVLYQSLGLMGAGARGQGAGIAGFVHLPSSLADGGKAGALTFEQALAGSLEIIAVCLEAGRAVA
jgi:pyroglutamyl-peptidase